MRNGVGSGLFTAYHGEHDWEVAHRVLVPAFGPLGIHDMYDEMYDVATQLIAKWARTEDEPINVSDDYTRLTLDSIALCAMDKRFNSFYHEKMHPFVDAMVGFLAESGQRFSRTRLEHLWNTTANRKYQEDIDLMRGVCQDVINRRRANPSSKKDLLNAMLFGKDPKTGERLTDESIMDNMITFLVAGHETTSGLLSFASYFLCKHPDVLRKAQAEVDSVVGKGPIKFEHMAKLPYLEAILRETLRLQPTAPAFSVEPQETMPGPVVLAGKYHIPAGVSLIAVLPAIGRDPVVFGADANEFRPERMYGEEFLKLPPNAWKPFGNGARGCIGRPFAWQEGLLALALILQNFNLRMDDPSYQLRIKQTLTIKPDGFYMRATLREGIDPIKLERKMYAGLDEPTTRPKTSAAVNSIGPKKPMTILYGSNSGTCEGLSQTLAGAAVTHGFEATIKSMDAVVDRLPTDQPLIIITASYEGNPPDNANAFVDWLKASSARLGGVKYAVYGCGHRDWVATYQRVPKLVDSELLARGAARIADRGESDVAAGTVFDDFDRWQDSTLWPQLGAATTDAAPQGIDLEINTITRASHLNHNVQEAIVLGNETLTAPGAPEKRHIQLKLPTNLTYEAGDYLAVLPINSHETVSRVMRRFNLPWDAVMTLSKGSHTTIPTEKELSVSAVLAAYVELNTAATKKNMSTISSFADKATEKQIAASVADTTTTPSVLDVLEAHQQIQLPFGVYLSMLYPMRIRQYSISSSPLQDPTIATITFSVADGDVEHLGVATNHLRSLQLGTTTQVMIKKSPTAFHLPLDEKLPVIMLCAGTGLAPFRGFVQDRVTRLQTHAGIELGEALLFVGCRDPNKDKLFEKELKIAEKMGAVKVHYAFSRAPEQSEGCKYVQDRLWHERDEVSRLFNNGARAYICGSSAVGKGVSDAAARIAMENAARNGRETTHEKALQWWEGLRGERYAVDVFD